MTKQELRNKVVEIIQEQLGVRKEEIADSADYANDLGADPLDCVELIMAFEEEFGFAISEEDSENCNTVGKTIEYLENRLNIMDN